MDRGRRLGLDDGDPAVAEQLNETRVGLQHLDVVRRGRSAAAYEKPIAPQPTIMSDRIVTSACARRVDRRAAAAPMSSASKKMSVTCEPTSTSERSSPGGPPRPTRRGPAAANYRAIATLGMAGLADDAQAGGEIERTLLRRARVAAMSGTCLTPAASSIIASCCLMLAFAAWR